MVGLSIITGILIIVLAILTIGFIYAQFADDIKDYIRERKSLNAPPCKICKHCDYNAKHVITCYCPSAIEWKENLNCMPTKWCYSSEVRGTKYCRYEKKEESNDVELG